MGFIGWYYDGVRSQLVPQSDIWASTVGFPLGVLLLSPDIRYSPFN